MWYPVVIRQVRVRDQCQQRIPDIMTCYVMAVCNSHWQHAQELCEREGKYVSCYSPTQCRVTLPQRISKWSLLLFRILEVRNSTLEAGSHRFFIMHKFNVLCASETWSPTLAQWQKQYTGLKRMLGHKCTPTASQAHFLFCNEIQEVLCTSQERKFTNLLKRNPS